MNRDERQRELVPPEVLARTHAVVVGVGAGGRQVALQLAAMGVGTLSLIDFDKVETVNLANQGWFEKDLNTSKVTACAIACRELNPNVQLRLYVERFKKGGKYARPPIAPPEVVCFACVDDIHVRKLIFEDCEKWAGLLIDGRMAGESGRVLAAWDHESRTYYASTLFRPEDAHAGRCTTQGTIYMSYLASSVMVSLMAQWLRGNDLPMEVSLNALAYEMVRIDSMVLPGGGEAETPEVDDLSRFLIPAPTGGG